MLSQILLFVVSLVIQSWIYRLLHLCVHLDAVGAQIAAGSAVAAAVVAAAVVLQCLLLYL